MLRITNTAMTQLKREIEEMGTWELLLAYCELRGGHVYRHVAADVERGLQDCAKRAREAQKERKAGLRRRLQHEKNGDPAELRAYSVFIINKEKIAELISACLMENIDAISAFVASGRKDFQCYLTLPEPIGIGILEEGDWKEHFLMSDMEVVVEHAGASGRLLQVKTAFPTFSEEIGSARDTSDPLASEYDKALEYLTEHLAKRRSLYSPI